MKVLITGGNGNIAKIILKKLTQVNNLQITSLTRNEFDLLDFNSINNYLSSHSFDILIHTAIIGGKRTKIDNEEVVFKNLLMFENLMKFSTNFKLIINFDSGAIYNRNTDILHRKEDELFTVPEDYYGFSKYIIYNRSLQYSNVVNFRIFNIFHVNEESSRFIKSCFDAKKNHTNITIFQDKYFDFMYEDDFVKIVLYYIENIDKKLEKTINICYQNKYKLSEIAYMIVKNNDHIIVENSICSNNYSGDGNLLSTLPIPLDDLTTSIEKYNILYK